GPGARRGAQRRARRHGRARQLQDGDRGGRRRRHPRSRRRDVGARHARALAGERGADSRRARQRARPGLGRARPRHQGHHRRDAAGGGAQALHQGGVPAGGPREVPVGMLATRQKVLRRFWYPVIPADRLADGPKPFTLLGERIVLWRDGEGRVSALEDRCCHRTAALSRGYYDGGLLVCGYHGWTYGHDGKVVRIPQLTRDTPPASARVRRFLAEERYGYVWTCLDDQPLFGIPQVEEWDDPRMRRIPQFYEVWRCSGLRLMENSFDNAHINFTHRGTFGDPQDAGESHTDLIAEPWGFRTRTQMVVKQTEAAAKANRIAGEKTHRRVEGTWWMPFMRRVIYEFPTGLRVVILTAATPIDDGHSQIVQLCLRTDR